MCFRCPRENNLPETKWRVCMQPRVKHIPCSKLLKIVQRQNITQFKQESSLWQNKPKLHVTRQTATDDKYWISCYWSRKTISRIYRLTHVSNRLSLPWYWTLLSDTNWEWQNKSVKKGGNHQIATKTLNTNTTFCYWKLVQ